MKVVDFREWLEQTALKSLITDTHLEGDRKNVGRGVK
jgi:hypothetical protein